MSVRSVVCSLSAIFALFLGGAHERVSAASPACSLVGDVDLFVESVEIVEGKATAHVVLGFELAGQPLEQEIPVPLEIAVQPGDEITPDMLTLSMEAVDLDLAGLVVELDDCEGGPIVLSMAPLPETQDPGGILIGMILDDVVAGGDLETILAELTEDESLLLSMTLADALNAAFVEVLAQGSLDCDADATFSAAKAGGSKKTKQAGKGKGKSADKSKGKGRGGKGKSGDDDEDEDDSEDGDDDEDDDDGDDSDSGSRRIELAEFEVEDGVLFETEAVAGATSGVCLEIYAQGGGKNNLLANMIRQLDHLQSRPGKTGKAQQAILKNLLRALDRLQIPAL